MTVGPYRVFRRALFYLSRVACQGFHSEKSSKKLIARQGALASEGQESMVSQEESVRSGATSLVLDLAQTLPWPTKFNQTLLLRYLMERRNDEAFPCALKKMNMESYVLLMLKAEIGGSVSYLVTRNFVR